VGNQVQIEESKVDSRAGIPEPCEDFWEEAYTRKPEYGGGIERKCGVEM
jgi:GH15 family glucan-1,4-alpha-glucosidase